MANTNTPFGFQEYYGGAGGAPTFAQSTRRVASTDSTAIFFGDPVMPVVSTANGYITQASPGTTVVAGIFVGCKYLSTSQKRTVWSNYWPRSDVASTDTVTGYIINDPNAKFVAQFGNVAVDQGYVNSGVGFNIGTEIGRAHA